MCSNCKYTYERNQIDKIAKSNINPKFFPIILKGRVNNPGEILVNSNAVLLEAIDIAGGTKVLKGPINFLRYRKDGSIDRRRFKIDYQASRGSYKNPYLKKNDTIFIGNSRFTAFNEVVSEVTSPITGLMSAYGLIKVIND